MAAIASETPAAAQRPGRTTLWNSAAVLAAALIMLWPAIYNRFPLLYPDSMTYLDDGRIVARAVFLHHFSDYYGMRSFFYSLGILPWHWNINPWPVVALQSLLTAYVLRLVVRAIVPRRTTAHYLLLVSFLSVTTSLSWYVSLVLPDFLGPFLYLSIYLLVFARNTLSRGERVSLYVIAWWAITSHATHLMLSAGLCVVLLLLFLLRRRSLRLGSIGEVALLVLLAAASQMALHGYLYGEPSLNGERPPFLTARVIADGPGRRYLDKHCSEVKWVICDHLNNLSSDPDNFLWGDGGLWQDVSDEEGKRILKEEVPFVLATIRAYPREQLSKSAANFRDQLNTFGLEDLDPSSWVLDEFDKVLPRAKASYLHSRQAQNAMPIELFTSFQRWIVFGSLVIIAVFVPILWRRRPPMLLGLGLIIAFTVVINALVTGTLSMVEDRLQCRVVWLVPLLAGLLILDSLSRYRESKKPPEKNHRHLPGEHTQSAKPFAV